MNESLSIYFNKNDKKIMSQKYSELKDQLENMHRESQLLKSANNFVTFRVLYLIKQM